jgi:death-on-curing protein
MKLEYVRGDVVRNIHGRLIEKYGGVAGIRDENAFESAIARPRNLHEFGEITSVGHLAAALAWALLRNHAFTDGNKRSAFAAMLVFLDINGYKLQCSEVEETAMVLRAAASELSEEEWIAWVERSVAVQR